MLITDEPLTPEEIADYIAKLNNWKLVDNKLYKEFEFPDFIAAFGFVARVACKAERMRHHPDIHITYNKVTLKLFTHQTKAITLFDTHFAQTIDNWDVGKP
jgi:4a-hydroxytetrahydrobiopterin dehydratase